MSRYHYIRLMNVLSSLNAPAQEELQPIQIRLPSAKFKFKFSMQFGTKNENIQLWYGILLMEMQNKIYKKQTFYDKTRIEFMSFNELIVQTKLRHFVETLNQLFIKLKKKLLLNNFL
eukprot:TRINITY_DN28646_c0_g1_i1.p4 TRINITY_DN28646_c0_g1~~TRINITY_DN28646_c0_g1_i1.p4  ORF type:complete len:117 (+),score=1.27 TRINITY_DN28646_c0_g1_i1:489-839(+)